MCLLSMWYRTFVDFEVKPHWVHCHRPPPRLLIIDSSSAECKCIFSMLRVTGRLSVESVNVRDQRMTGLAELVAVDTIVARMVQMLGFNVIVQVGGFGLQTAVAALP